MRPQALTYVIKQGGFEKALTPSSAGFKSRTPSQHGDYRDCVIVEHRELMSFAPDATRAAHHASRQHEVIAKMADYLIGLDYVVEVYQFTSVGREPHPNAHLFLVVGERAA